MGSTPTGGENDAPVAQFGRAPCWAELFRLARHFDLLSRALTDSAYILCTRGTVPPLSHCGSGGREVKRERRTREVGLEVAILERVCKNSPVEPRGYDARFAL